MSKTTYTDEEVKKVLRSLFIEKKRVQELQEKVQELGSERNELTEKLSHTQQQLETTTATIAQAELSPSSIPEIEGNTEQVEKLKKLLLSLKQKYEELQQRRQSEDLERQQRLESLSAGNEGKVKQAQSDLEQLKSDLFLASQNSEALQANYAALESDCAALKGQQAVSSHQLKVAQEEESKAKGEVAEMRRRLQLIEEQRSRLEYDNQLLKAQEQKHKFQVDQIVQEGQEAKAGVIGVNQRLNNDIATLKADLQRLSEERAYLVSELRKAGSFTDLEKKKIQELEGLVAASQEREHRQQQQQENLLKEFAAKDKRIAELKDFEYSFKKISEQKHHLDHAIGKERDLIRTFHAEKEKLQQQLSGYEEQLQQAENRLEEMRLQSGEKAGLCQELQDQVGAANSRTEALEVELSKAEDTARALKQALHEERTERKDIEDRYSKVKEEFDRKTHEREAALETIEKELDLAKQTLVRGIREAKEIEARYLESVNEKVMAVTKYHQLREESDKKKEEIKELREDLKGAEESRDTFKTRIENLQQSLEAAKAHHQTNQDRITRLELERQTGSNEKAVLQGELDLSRTATAELQDKISGLQAQLFEQESLQQELQRREETFLQQAQETSAAKQQLEGTVRDLQERLSKAQEVEQARRELEERYDLLREEHDELSSAVEEAAEARLEAERQREQMSALCHQREQLLLDRDSQLASITEERERIHQELLNAQNIIEDRESRLKAAHQHLAKKVKEVTVCNERIEEQKLQQLELQRTLEHHKSRTRDLANHLEEMKEQERRLQGLLNESIKSAESQVGKWEEKYFRMYDKWQETEARAKELKKQEQKYNQLQGLLANLGNFISSPLALSIQSPLMNAEGSPDAALQDVIAQPAKEMDQSMTDPSEQMSEARASRVLDSALDGLFGMQKEKTKVRDTLF